MVEIENPAEEEMNEEIMKKKNEEIMKKQQEFEILESEKIDEAMKKRSEGKFDFWKWAVVFLVIAFVGVLGVVFL